MAYQIFISYRRESGEALAYLLNEKLKNAGFKVFYDLESLSSGKFNTKLFEVIDSCQNILVILTPNSLDRCVNDGDWMRLEIAHAIQKGKNIIPIMTRGFCWPDYMPNDISEIQHYNGVTVSFEFFEGVLSKIAKCLINDIQLESNISRNMELKHILLWGDFDDAVLEKIVKKLALEDNFYIEILDTPMEILSKNLNEIYAIILIVTDCTKLSNNIYALKRINENISSYVRKGGKIICAHDVIYRRTRNEKLQEVFGCKLTYFQRAETVTYKKTSYCTNQGKFSSLPDEFDLHDAEICWGDLADDAEIYFETSKGIPLVFSREYGRGICIYLNSGDFKDNPPKSIRKPEREFIDLLREAIVLEY